MTLGTVWPNVRISVERKQVRPRQQHHMEPPASGLPLAMNSPRQVHSPRPGHQRRARAGIIELVAINPSRLRPLMRKPYAVLTSGPVGCSEMRLRVPP